jgi:hypothetical protein
MKMNARCKQLELFQDSSIIQCLIYTNGRATAARTTPLSVVAVLVGTAVRVMVEESSESAAGTSLATKKKSQGHDLQKCHQQR